jgi:cysteine-rich repeat protein
MQHFLVTWALASLVCWIGTETDTGTDTDATDGDTDTSSETETTAEPEPVCGDGNVDPNEFCDDGNLDGLDGCNAHCAEPGIALWDVVFVDDQGPMREGPAVVDVDDSIHFASALGGLLAVDHATGDSSVSNPVLDFGLLLRQDAGRLVAYDWNIDVVVGIDTTGEGLWTLPLDGRLQSLAVDGMGNVIVLENDHALSSLDANGDINWQTTAPTTPNAIMAADRSGIYILGGDLHEHWMYGLDGDGDLEWDTVDASLDAEFRTMAVSNGRIVTVGSERVGEDGNYDDFFVRVYDTRDGDLAWNDRIDGPFDLGLGEQDRGQCIAFDAAGNIVVGGTIGLEGDASNALWLGRYSTGGRLLWTKTIDDGVAHDCKSLTALSDGDLLVSDGWTPSRGSAPEGRMLLFMP